MVIEFRATNGAVLAAALDELDYAEPVEGVVAGKTSPLGHQLLANRAFLPRGLGVIDQRVVVVDVPKESAELFELIDFLVELLEQSEDPLPDEDLDHRQGTEDQAARDIEEEAAVAEVNYIGKDFERKVDVKFVYHMCV